MCVCKTATRRRRQMKLDKRYKVRDTVTAQRIAAAQEAKRKAMQARKKK